jgi:hypothetical protein
MLKGLSITCASKLLPLIGTGRLSVKRNLYSPVTEKSMSSLKAGIALRPELERSGLLNSMTGKVFQEDRSR